MITRIARALRGCANPVLCFLLTGALSVMVGGLVFSARAGASSAPTVGAPSSGEAAPPRIPTTRAVTVVRDPDLHRALTAIRRRHPRVAGAPVPARRPRSRSLRAGGRSARPRPALRLFDFVRQ